MQLRTFLAALACAVGSLSAAPLPAQDQAGLTRLTTPSAARAFRAVGLVTIDRARTCTGTLIAPDLVLTAAHCLVNNDGSRVDPSKIVFMAGLLNGTQRAIETARNTATPEEYNPSSGSNQQRFAIDLGLIRLRNSVTSMAARPFSTTPMQFGDVDVTVVSYGRGRNDAPSLQRDCSILGHSGTLHVLDCNGHLGSSGAPVFVDRNGTLQIASIISGILDENGQRMTIGSAVSPLLASLRDQLSGPVAVRRQSSGAALNGVGVGQRSASGPLFITVGE